MLLAFLEAKAKPQRARAGGAGGSRVSARRPTWANNADDAWPLYGRLRRDAEAWRFLSGDVSSALSQTGDGELASRLHWACHKYIP